MLIDISKNKKLTIYKSIITNFHDYYTRFPMTVSDKYLELIVYNGLKIVPTDERAQDVLIYILSTYDKPEACVQHLLNDKFDSLPPEIRPVVEVEKGDGKFATAKWANDTGEHTSIWSMINLDGSKKAYWSLNDEKVKLVKE